MVFPDESSFCFLSGDSLQPTEDPLVGTTVAGRYRVEGLLQQTPWARTYRARERLVDVACTLKVFGPGLGEADRERFTDALTKARRLAHPNIVEILGGGTTDDGVAFVAHPVRPECQPLAVDRAKDATEALGLVLQILCGLARVHDFGARHGQLHPRNILQSRDGHLELIDVGLGRLIVHEPWEEANQALEAQHYQAPEVSSGERSTIQGDLYAVGVIAHQLLVGTKPVDAPDMRQLRDAHSARERPDLGATAPQLAAPLQRWLSRMLTRTPDGRPPNAHQAIDELMSAAGEAGIQPKADPRGDTTPALVQASLDPQLRRWSTYRGIFAKMLEMGFPNGAPEPTRNALTHIATLIERLEGLAQGALTEHEKLRDALHRAREGRENIARQMSELNEGAKEVHREVEPLRIAADRHGDKAKGFPDEAKELHREIIRWEGRSSFTEPYKELAEAYRSMAELMDRWWSVRSAQLACEADADERREELVTFSEQLDELREALRIHESNLFEELTTIESTLADLGKQADEIELELLDAASRFSAPLRSKPELGGAFRELADASRA